MFTKMITKKIAVAKWHLFIADMLEEVVKDIYVIAPEIMTFKQLKEEMETVNSNVKVIDGQKGALGVKFYSMGLLEFMGLDYDLKQLKEDE